MEPQASPAILVGSPSTQMAPDRGSRRRYTLNAIPREHVASVWPAVPQYTRDEEQAEELCRNGTYQLFLIFDAETSAVVGSFLAELVTDAARTVANGFGLSGHELARWLFLVSDFEEWARQHGAAAVELVEEGKTGRAWNRLLSDYFVTSQEGKIMTLRKRL